MNKGLRAVAVVTLTCFLTTQCVSAGPAAGIEITGGRELPTYLSIDVPAELGTVDALYEAPGGASPKFILHIQNAHANYQAQMKIKQLLQYMNKKYGFQTIFVEGASEKLDADYLRLFPDQERNLKLCDELAKQGELTGAELFLMEQSADPRSTVHDPRGPVEALGIEQAALYRSNYEALKKVFGAEADVARFFKGFDAKLDKVASQTFTPETRELIADWKRFEQGRRDFMPFVKNLTAKSKKIMKVDLENLFAQVGWPQISRLLVIQQMEKELDKTKGLEEKTKLIDMLRTIFVSKELIATLESFNEGSIAVGKSASEVSPREVLERLAQEAGPKGFKFSDYPAFSLFAGYVTLRSELDPKVLFEEIEYLFTQMLDTLAQDPQQKTLLALYRDGELLRKLLHLELNRTQWRKLLANRDQIAISSLVSRLQSAVKGVRSMEYGAKTDDTVRRTPSASALGDVMPKAFGEKMEGLFTAGLEFYDFARQREAVFYKEMQSQMSGKNITKAILITGGFHTDGMSDIFRENAVSYGIVTPRLSEKSDERLYRKIMLQNEERPFSISYLEAAMMMQDPLALIAQLGRKGFSDKLEGLINTLTRNGMSLTQAVNAINTEFKRLHPELPGEFKSAGLVKGKPFYKWQTFDQAPAATVAEIGGVLEVEAGTLSPGVAVRLLGDGTAATRNDVAPAARSEARRAAFFKGVPTVGGLLVVGALMVFLVDSAMRDWDQRGYEPNMRQVEAVTGIDKGLLIDQGFYPMAMSHYYDWLKKHSAAGSPADVEKFITEFPNLLSPEAIDDLTNSKLLIAKSEILLELSQKRAALLTEGRPVTEIDATISIALSELEEASRAGWVRQTKARQTLNKMIAQVRATFNSNPDPTVRQNALDSLARDWKAYLAGPAARSEARSYREQKIHERYDLYRGLLKWASLAMGATVMVLVFKAVFALLGGNSEVGLPVQAAHLAKGFNLLEMILKVPGAGIPAILAGVVGGWFAKVVPQAILEGKIDQAERAATRRSEARGPDVSDDRPLDPIVYGVALANFADGVLGLDRNLKEDMLALIRRNDPVFVTHLKKYYLSKFQTMVERRYNGWEDARDLLVALDEVASRISPRMGAWKVVLAVLMLGFASVGPAAAEALELSKPTAEIAVSAVSSPITIVPAEIRVENGFVRNAQIMTLEEDVPALTVTLQSSPTVRAEDFTDEVMLIDAGLPAGFYFISVKTPQGPATRFYRLKASTPDASSLKAMPVVKTAEVPVTGILSTEELGQLGRGEPVTRTIKTNTGEAEVTIRRRSETRSLEELKALATEAVLGAYAIVREFSGLGFENMARSRMVQMRMREKERALDGIRVAVDWGMLRAPVQTYKDDIVRMTQIGNLLTPKQMEKANEAAVVLDAVLSLARSETRVAYNKQALKEELNSLLTLDGGFSNYSLDGLKDPQAVRQDVLKRAAMGQDPLLIAAEVKIDRIAKVSAETDLSERAWLGTAVAFAVRESRPSKYWRKFGNREVGASSSERSGRSVTYYDVATHKNFLTVDVEANTPLRTIMHEFYLSLLTPAEAPARSEARSAAEIKGDLAVLTGKLKTAQDLLAGMMIMPENFVDQQFLDGRAEIARLEAEIARLRHPAEAAAIDEVIALLSINSEVAQALKAQDISFSLKAAVSGFPVLTAEYKTKGGDSRFIDVSGLKPGGTSVVRGDVTLKGQAVNILWLEIEDNIGFGYIPLDQRVLNQSRSDLLNFRVASAPSILRVTPANIIPVQRSEARAETSMPSYKELKVQQIERRGEFSGMALGALGSLFIAAKVAAMLTAAPALAKASILAVVIALSAVAVGSAFRFVSRRVAQVFVRDIVVQDEDAEGRYALDYAEMSRDENLSVPGLAAIYSAGMSLFSWLVSLSASTRASLDASRLAGEWRAFEFPKESWQGAAVFGAVATLVLGGQYLVRRMGTVATPEVQSPQRVLDLALSDIAELIRRRVPAEVLEQDKKAAELVAQAEQILSVIERRVSNEEWTLSEDQAVLAQRYRREIDRLMSRSEVRGDLGAEIAAVREVWTQPEVTDGKYVLMLEDHPFVRQGLTSLLQSNGYVVVPVAGVKDAFRFLKENLALRGRPGMILTDNSMPERDDSGRIVSHDTASGAEWVEAWKTAGLPLDSVVMMTDADAGTRTTFRDYFSVIDIHIPVLDKSRSDTILEELRRLASRSEMRELPGMDDATLREAALTSKDAAFAAMERIQEIDSMIAQLALETGARESVLLLEVEKSFLTGNPLSAPLMNSLRAVERESVQRMLSGLEGELIGAESKIKLLDQRRQEEASLLKRMDANADPGVRKNAERRVENLRRQIAALSQNVGQLEALLEEYRSLLASQPEERSEMRSVVEERQAFADAVERSLAPEVRDWYEQNRPTFGTALLDSVLWGIVTPADGVSAEAVKVGLVVSVMTKYRDAMVSGTFNRAIFLENVRGILAAHPAFSVSQEPGAAIKYLTEMPTDAELGAIGLQLLMNPRQEVVWFYTKESSLDPRVLEAEIVGMAKSLSDASGITTRLRLVSATSRNLADQMKAEASRANGRMNKLATLLVEKDSALQGKLVGSELIGNVLLTEKSKPLAGLQGWVAMRLSQHSVKQTAQDLAAVAEVLGKEFGVGVVKRVQGGLELDNKVLAALETVLNALLAHQATSVAA